MDALSVRARGKRAAPKSKGGAPFNIGASIGLASTGRPGEFKLNGDQIGALEALYTSSPAITAARSVLRGQLFGGGIVLRRGGEDVKLKPEFQRYLSSKWLAFAGDVLDSFLKWGLCCVVYDEDVDLKRRAAKVAARGAKPDPVLAPLVPPRETIEIAYRQSGLMGYSRQYVVFNMTSPQHATRVDEDARVFIREQPDEVGNVISPMSKCFELGSFVTALTELALTSEITNARPRMWTQMAKADKGQGVESTSLFFDRFVAHLSHSLLRQTHPFIRVCSAANRARCSPTSTRRATPSRPRRWRCRRSSSGSSTSCSSASRTTLASTTSATPLAARVSPAAVIRTFRRKFRLRSSAYPRCVFYSNLRSAAPTLTARAAISQGQEVAPSAGQLPTARGDLEQLQRLSVELFGAAFGVPSDLLFSGRHIPPAAPTPPRAFHSHRKPAYAAQVCQQVNGAVVTSQQLGHVAGEVDQPSPHRGVFGFVR